MVNLTPENTRKYDTVIRKIFFYEETAKKT